jgi:hypothetical protein
MPAISIQDLENAKTDVDHIAEVSTSLAPTATDRLGHVKPTLAGAVGSIAAINDRGAWATGAAYLIKDIVTVAGIVYVCVSGHTAGATFAGDSAKWRVHQGATVEDLANTTDPAKGAGMVGFIQAGTGAVKMSAQDMLRETVTPKQFGAAWDGVTNDAAAIQAAYDYLAGSGGGKLTIPRGTGYIGTTSLIFNKSNVAVVGKGKSSIIKASAEMTSPAIYWGDGSTTPRPGNVRLSDFQVDGGGSTAITAHGVYVWASLTPVTNLFVQNCGGYGLYFFQSWTMWVKHNQCSHNGEGGVYIGQECNNFTFDDNECNWNLGHGIVVNGGHGIRMRGNGTEENFKYGTYFLGNAASAIRAVVYKGNYHENNGKNPATPDEIYVDRAGSEISDLLIDRNVLTAVLTNRNIRIASVNSCRISNNSRYNVGIVPSYIGTTLENESGVDTSGMDNGSHAACVDNSPTTGTTFWGRLGSLTVASQEGTTRGTLFRVTGRYSASHYPVVAYGDVDHYFGTTAMTSGTHKVGDIVWNVAPSAGSYIGWVCTNAGTPGTWKGFGAIQA